MKLRPLVVLAIVALVWLAGCATVSFKRGAGPGSAKADEDACRATTTSPEAYSDCLRERGWMVSTPGAGTTATEPVDEPPSAPATKPAPADAGFVPAAPAGKPAPAAPPAASAPAVSKSGATVAPAASAPHTAPPSAPATTGTTAKPATAPAAAVAKKPLDPMAKLTVSSWWKMGGTNADLDAAVAACVTELGPAHRPNVGPTEVTVALRDCLRTKKWFAVGGTGGVGAK